MATAASFSQLECLLLTFNALGAVMIVVAMFRQWNPRENDIDRVKGELGFIEESKET